MFEKVRDYLEEVINIAEKCPEKYQAKCFEILLDALVKGETAVAGAVAGTPAIGAQVPGKPEPAFFSHYSISYEWTRVFHFDGSSYLIIVQDLKEKAKAKKQVKLALLLGIKELLETGEASISKEALIDICKKYAAYDSPNFSSNMRKHKNLFLAKDDGWSLTMPGQEKAAEIIKELVQ